jgi:hypothetical protein
VKGGEELNNQDEQEYNLMLALEDLESLHEELEEHGLIGLDSGRTIPDELLARMKAHGVRDIQQIHSRIMQLHAELDEDGADLTITDS